MYGPLPPPPGVGPLEFAAGLWANRARVAAAEVDRRVRADRLARGEASAEEMVAHLVAGGMDAIEAETTALSVELERMLDARIHREGA